MAHALQEIERIDGEVVDIDDTAQVPFDDAATFALIQSSKTLGCFQIESPGQRELVGKFAPETFEDIIIDISLFRPGPVKSDMVTPFLRARQGWSATHYLHPDLEPILAPTCGVVVFHEQVLEMIAQFTGCTLAEADEARRALGDPEGKHDVKVWFFPRTLGRGYDRAITQRVWEVLEAFASFGFCKAHAAAFALPTYQSAWLKAHHPAAFLSGVLTYDPGMYPKRLILDDARQFGIAVLPLDVNSSADCYRVERVGVDDEPPPEVLGQSPRRPPDPQLPDGRAYGIRLSLAEVKGISDAEVGRIIAGRPYHSLTDLWHRARPSRPIAERLVLAGALDSLYGIGSPVPVRRRGKVTRRDLLLQVAELDQWSRATDRARRAASPRRRGSKPPPADAEYKSNGSWSSSLQRQERPDVRAMAAAQSMASKPAEPVTAVQLAFDLGDQPGETEATGLPEMSVAERVRAELEILGLDVSRHVVDFYAPLLDALGITRSAHLLSRRSRAQLLVAGVKVATQTPPIRSGRRVIFLTLDDGTGPVDATFFEDAQGPYAATLFHSWLLLVRGELRRTGPRGVSLQATGCWELPQLYETWQAQGLSGVHAVLDQVPEGFGAVGEQAVRGAAESRSTRPVMAAPPSFGADGSGEPPAHGNGMTAGGMGRRRVLVHRAGSSSRPMPTSNRPARTPRPLRASCGTPAPGARDDDGRIWIGSTDEIGCHRVGPAPHRITRVVVPKAGRPGRYRPPDPAPVPTLPTCRGGLTTCRGGFSWQVSVVARCVPPWSGMPSMLRSTPGPTPWPDLSRWSISVAAPVASPYGWPSSGTPSRWSIPAPTPSPRSNVALPRAAYTTGFAACSATPPDCATFSGTPTSTWCCATESWRSSTTRRRRWLPYTPCCGPVGCSVCWPSSGTPPCSPERSQVTWPMRGCCSMIPMDIGGPATRCCAGSPRTRSSPCSPARRSHRRPFTAYAPSPTWYPAPGRQRARRDHRPTRARTVGRRATRDSGPWPPSSTWSRSATERVAIPAALPVPSASAPDGTATMTAGQVVTAR
jgi:hypothetical protein